MTLIGMIHKNESQHNYIYPNDTHPHNNTQQNDTQQNDIQQKWQGTVLSKFMYDSTSECHSGQCLIYLMSWRHFNYAL
jgi:hypothetical protein